MQTFSFFHAVFLNQKQKRWCSYVFCDKSAILRCGNTNEPFRVPLVRSLAVFLVFKLVIARMAVFTWKDERIMRVDIRPHDA